MKSFNSDLAAQFATDHSLQYYNAEVHQAAFALPTFIKDMLVRD
ncbi:MAG: hypothetical protein AAFN12_12015 [Cyanobacteria bacterium J06560_2]